MKQPSTGFLVALSVIALATFGVALLNSTSFSAPPGSFRWYVRSAPYIVSGEVLEVTAEAASIQVSEFLKGSRTASTVRIYVDTFVVGAARFEERDEVVVFLRPEREAFEVIGGSSGLYTRVRHPELGDIALNGPETQVWRRNGTLDFVAIRSIRPLLFRDFLATVRR